MTYAFETYRSDGSTVINGSSGACIFLGLYTIPGTSASGYASFPQAPAGSIYCFNANAGSHDFDTVSPGGDPYARINWTQRAGQTQATTLIVFAKKTNNADTFGLLLLNDAGDTLVDSSHPVPQYAGYIQPTVDATSTYQCPDGLRANVHNVPMNIRPGTNRIVLLKMPDSGTDDIWYSCDSFISSSVTSTVSLNVTVYAPAGVAYQVPTMHIFSIDGPVNAGGDYALHVMLADQTLVYDSSAENISVRDATAVTYPAVGSTATYSLALPVNPGVSIPYFYQHVRHIDGSADVYTSVAKRVGTQMTFKSLHVVHHNIDAAGNTSFQLGASANSYCVVVDLSQLGGASASGTPAPTVQFPVAITSQPSGQTVTVGYTATFDVTASGTPAPTFQWQKNGVDIPGATSSTLSFTASSGQNGNSYRCIASNTTSQPNNAVSSAAALTVVADPTTNPPAITSNPTGGTYSAGATVTLSCSASGSGLTYSWWKSGAGAAFTTGSSCSFTAGSTTAGSYYCVVSNAYGSATSGSATVTVTAVADPAPVISVQPASTSTPRDTAVTLSCVASPVTIYDWYRDGSYVGSGTNHSPDVSASGTFSYYCICTNGSTSTTSSTATLTVTAPYTGTYMSYNNVTVGALSSSDPRASWTISADGTTSVGGNWANGTGNGDLYSHTASLVTGSFVAAGGGALGTAYAGSATWIEDYPTSTTSGAFRQASLLIISRLISSGAEVCRHTVTLQTVNP